MIVSNIIHCDDLMIHAIKKHATVQADGSIQIYVPEFKAGTITEVIVLESSEQGKKRSLVNMIGKGRGCFASSEEVDSFIVNERNSWE